jgi:hypothetical protein
MDKKNFKKFTQTLFSMEISKNLVREGSFERLFAGVNKGAVNNRAKSIGDLA